MNEYLKSTKIDIDKRLNELLPLKEAPYKDLFAAARYSLLSGGKRIRPILALATTEALGGNYQQALTPVCALEMIHAYSLIHDDLPCMDNDDYRRGNPTLHKVYSEGHAVLTGDFLLTYAFQVLAESPHLTAEQRIKLISILARQAGGEGMIAGQVMDIAVEGKKIDLETLQLIHKKKTGALITASIEFGTVIADADEEHKIILSNFGKDIGLAFQIIDDVLDVTSSEEKHGTKIASDTINDKTTYVTLLGVEQAQAVAQSLYKESICTLKSLPYDTSRLLSLADIIVNRKN